MTTKKNYPSYEVMIQKAIISLSDSTNEINSVKNTNKEVISRWIKENYKIPTKNVDRYVGTALERMHKQGKLMLIEKNWIVNSNNRLLKQPEEELVKKLKGKSLKKSEDELVKKLKGKSLKKSEGELITNLLVFELSWKQDDYEPWFSVSLRDNFDQKKLYNYIKVKFDKEDLTYVDTKNKYTFNIQKFDTMIENISKNTPQESYMINENETKVNTDPDIDLSDKGNYLYPITWRVVVTNMNNIVII